MNYSKNYYDIKKKKDIATHVKFKNRFVHYPLYDTANNSYIHRYKMWAKYRDKCKTKGVKYIDCKNFAKVIRLIGKKIEETIMTDPEGVVFKHFKIRQEFYRVLGKKNYLEPVMKYYTRSKKKNSLTLKSWKILPSDSYNLRLNNALKEGKIKDYDFNKSTFEKRLKLTDLDLFDDF